MHAAEASLSQLINLMLAYVLLRGLGIGRPSAVSSMRIKFVSFVMVTIGLFLCTIDDSAPKHTAAAATKLSTAATRADLRSLPGDASGASGVAAHAAGAVAVSAVQRVLRTTRRRRR